MLVCDVYLGKQKTLRAARQVQPEDLEEYWVKRAFGCKAYNSVYAPGGFWGAVAVPEYIVYKAHQAIPHFVIEFTTEDH